MENYITIGEAMQKLIQFYETSGRSQEFVQTLYPQIYWKYYKNCTFPMCKCTNIYQRIKLKHTMYLLSSFILIQLLIMCRPPAPAPSETTIVEVMSLMKA